MARVKRGKHGVFMYDNARCRCDVCRRAHRRRAAEAARVRARKKAGDRRAAADKRRVRPLPAWQAGGTMTREQYLRERDADAEVGAPRSAAPRKTFIPII